ncbi:MAG: ABC transporter permease [Magnetovibrionaceae bacterium]
MPDGQTASPMDFSSGAATAGSATPRLPRRRKGRMGLNVWTIGTALVSLCVALPLLSIVYLAFGDNQDIWSHLARTVLPSYLKTTLGLMIGVGLGTLVIGVSTAWLVTLCRFPGRRIFEWLLLLPIAVPAYIVAFIYTDLLEYAGPVQGMLRDIFGWTSPRAYWFPEVRSLGGAIMMMTLTLYPYVYLLSRAAFTEQCVCVIEVSRTLGKGPWASFFAVALPLARPAIVIGVALVLMEALNDFGTVDYFAVKTFSAGIYDVWLNMNSVAGAAQLSLVLLAFVLVLIAAERWARGAKSFRHATNRYRALPNYKLSGWRALAAFLACALPITLGFIVPGSVLVGYALEHYEVTLEANYFRHLLNSMTLSVTAAVVALMIGLFLAYSVRISNSPALRSASRFASIGYAMPGAVLAVGILVPFGAFDNAVDGYMRETFGISTGLLLSGTIAAMTFGYVARFLALSFGSAEASLTKVTPSIEGASRTLGQGPFGTLKRIHFPLIRGSVLAAALLVFVDSMKELPMTVVLRPFNFDTLATFTYQYASDELFEESALAALTIVGAGIIPVILLTIGIRSSRPGQSQG